MRKVTDPGRIAIRWVVNCQTLRPLVTPVWMFVDLVCAYLKIPLMAHPGREPSALLMTLVSLSVRKVYGPKKIALGTDEAIVVCRVKDGEEYVRSFIDHHLSLGVGHIVLLDNDSSDRTVSIACQYQNVTVLRTPLPYRTYNRVFNAYLRKHYISNCWGLCLDIDELFDYPHSDKISLKKLLEYLIDRSCNAVLANMLEMFADEPLASLEGKGRGQDLKTLYKYYDLEGVLPIALDSALESRMFMGGIRKTVFGTGGPLHKFPLFFLNTGLTYKDFGNHNILGGSPRVADFSCVLYHYQFTGSLRARCNHAVRHNQYAHRSVKYRSFLQLLDLEPHLNVKERATRALELKGTNELIERGFLYVSEEFIRYAEGCDASQKE